MKRRERWKVRRACHGSWWLCCQYTDLPTCNSPSETHLVGRIHRRWARWRYER